MSLYIISENMKFIILIIFVHKVLASPIQDDRVIFPVDESDENSANEIDNDAEDTLSNLNYDLLNDPNLLPTDSEVFFNSSEEEFSDNLEYGNYFQGDIDLSPQQEIFMNSLDDDEEELSTRTGLRSLFTRWSKDNKGKVIVPYKISDEYSYTQKNRIRASMTDIEKYTCVKFNLHKNQKDYVYIRSGDGCSSKLGKIGGQQDISLNKTGCLKHGTIMHELIHALGFTHMHNRADRDEHVKILWDNILKNHVHNFKKVSPKEYINFGNSYDFHSVMHYGPKAFTKNKSKKTIVVKDKNKKNIIGQRVRLSKGDAERLNKMYDCKM